MQAIQILGSAPDAKIVVSDDVAEPVPRAGEMLIRVYAAAITGDEKTWPEVFTIPSRIPGHEMSGVIEQLGTEYTGSLKVGDEVFALLSAGRGQCQAEWLTCPASEVAIKPTTVSHVVASALPMACLTAWEMLDYAEISAGAKVLVTGASGAVGQLLVQLLAQTTQATIIALASDKHIQRLKSLGAAQVVDYRENWQAQVGRPDVIFDLVGSDILSACWQVVQPQGTIVTIGDPAPAWAFNGQAPAEVIEKPNVKYKYFIVKPNAERLARSAQMLDEGVLQPLEIKVYSLEQGMEAWTDASTRSRGYKVVLEMWNTQSCSYSQ